MCQSGGEKVYTTKPVVEVRPGQAGFDELSGNFDDSRVDLTHIPLGQREVTLTDFDNTDPEYHVDDLLGTRRVGHGLEIYFQPKDGFDQRIDFIDGAQDADLAVGDFFGNDGVLDIAARITMDDGSTVFRGYEGALEPDRSIFNIPSGNIDTGDLRRLGTDIHSGGTDGIVFALEWVDGKWQFRFGPAKPVAPEPKE